MRVTLVLTHQCNLGCSYCYTGKKFDRAMPDEIAWRALRLGFLSEPDELLNVSFFGGEPLLEFENMVRWTRVAARWARKSGRELEFSITTNATIVSEKILRFLSHYPYRVAFSVDGLGADHDRYRHFVGGRGSSEVVWANLQKARAYVPDATILMVVNPDTVAGLPAAVAALHDLGYQNVTLLPNMDIRWTPEARRQADVTYRELLELTLARPSLMLTPLVGRITETGEPGPVRARCGFGSDDVAVSPQGRLYPCARLVGTDTRQEVQMGDVQCGIDAGKVKQIQARAKAKLAGCGADSPCSCSAVMPGNNLLQMDNHNFFHDLYDAVVRRQPVATLEGALF